MVFIILGFELLLLAASFFVAICEFGAWYDIDLLFIILRNFISCNVIIATILLASYFINLGLK